MLHHKVKVLNFCFNTTMIRDRRTQDEECVGKVEGISDADDGGGE